MNYEELLELRQGENPRGVNTPIGTLARRQVDGQWRYELRLDSQFTEDPLFISALEQDEAATRLVNRPEQAKFSVERDSAGPYALLLPKGNYTIVCCDGVINEKGLGTLQGDKAVVDPQSALILHD